MGCSTILSKQELRALFWRRKASDLSAGILTTQHTENNPYWLVRPRPSPALGPAGKMRRCAPCTQSYGKALENNVDCSCEIVLRQPWLGFQSHWLQIPPEKFTSYMTLGKLLSLSESISSPITETTLPWKVAMKP